MCVKLSGTKPLIVYIKMAGPQQSPEVLVRKRILSIIDYLSRIQQE